MRTMSDLYRIVGGVEGLTEREAAILAMAKRRFVFPGQREAALRDELGLTGTRYHQLLARIIDTPAALAAEPVLVRRLLRLREQRAARRSASRRGVA